MNLLALVPAAALLHATAVSAVQAAPAAISTQSSRPAAGQGGHYTDGVYTATGKYGGAPSFITVTATVKSDIVTDVKVQTHATVPRSLELQRAFAAAVPKVVIGKRLDQVQVGKLAGSSTTPDGFNDAIRQIKQDAQGH